MRLQVVLAMVNVSAQIASIYGPFLWPNSDSPRFVIGFSASAAFSLLSLLVSYFMRFLLKRENKRVHERQAADAATVNTYAY